MSGIQIQGIRKVYPNGFEAVKGIDLDIAGGEFMVLVGPSGCGKSTLLRMIAGLEEISEGTLLIATTSRTSLRASATSRWSSRTTRSIRT